MRLMSEEKFGQKTTKSVKFLEKTKEYECAHQ